MAGYVKKTTESKMDRMVIKFECTADSADGSVPDQTLESSRGMYLYGAYSEPGSGGAQPDAYNFTVYDDSGKTLSVFAPSSNRSQTDKEHVDGSNTLGKYPLMTGNEVVDIDDLGNSNTTVIELVFIPSWTIQ